MDTFSACWEERQSLNDQRFQELNTRQKQTEGWRWIHLNQEYS